MAIQDYSAIAPNNTRISGVNIAENCPPSGINDAIRQLMADLAGALQAGLFVPSGSVVAFAGPAAPAGFLACDGAVVSRTGYAALFRAIGVGWGAGDGVSTFAVPDLRGRAAIGAGQGGGLSPRGLAQTGGEEAHVLSIGEMPSHSHTPVVGALVASGAAGGGSGLAAGATVLNTGLTLTGGGGGHNTMPPFAVVSFIIKA